MANDFEDKLASMLNQILQPCGTLEGLIARESDIGELRAYRKLFGFPVEQVAVETERFINLSKQLDDILSENK